MTGIQFAFSVPTLVVVCNITKRLVIQLTTKVVNIQIHTKVGRIFFLFGVISNQQCNRKQKVKSKKMESEKYFNLVPSIGGSFGFGWRKMFDKAFLPLLVAVIIAGVLNGPVGASWKADHDFGFALLLLPVILFGLAYKFMFMPIIEYGENFLFLKAMRDEEAELRILFDGFKKRYLDIVLANLIVFALVMIGLVMLIIPGIIIWCRLAFVSYLVMDKELEPMKAIEKSWQMTKGHGWTIFFMTILSFFIFIAGVIVFIFGALISIMWIHSAFATLYQAVLNQNDDDNPIPILGVNEV